MGHDDVREFYELKDTLVRGVSMLGYDAIDFADERGLSPHDHGGAYELCLIVDGGVEWWVGEEVYAVGPGEVYITRPHERHGGVDSVLQPCELYWCIFELGADSGFAGLPDADREQLAAQFAAMNHRTFRATAGVGLAFEAVFTALRQGGPLDELAARTAVVRLLLATLQSHDRLAAAQREVSASMAEAKQWIMAHLGEAFSMDDVAEHVGLSVNRFHERFRREVGFAPGDWRLRKRIDLAKRLLRRSDISVTDVAMRGGFTSSQYFATSFKKMVGLTPSEYRGLAGRVTPDA